MNDDVRINRRKAIQAAIGTALLLPSALRALHVQRGTETGTGAGTLIKRTIPSSGEQLSAIGVGTARGYTSPTNENRDELQQIIQRFVSQGGSMIDTSPDYGNTEVTLGEIITSLSVRDRLFVADTITSGPSRALAIAQVEESMRRLRTDKIDLLQIAVASVSAETVSLVKDLKSSGRVRYMGVVGVGADQHQELEVALRNERFDFVQVDMSVDDRRAAKRVLPLAADRGTAVIIDHPFGRGSVFTRVLGKAIPSWAKEIDAKSWAQIFLKYLIAQPAVTVVVPGTERLEYLEDNLGAARGKLPNASIQRRIEAVMAQ